MSKYREGASEGHRRAPSLHSDRLADSVQLSSHKEVVLVMSEIVTNSLRKSLTAIAIKMVEIVISHNISGLEEIRPVDYGSLQKRMGHFTSQRDL